MKNITLDYETVISAITDYVCYQTALQIRLKPEAVEMVTLFHWNLLDDLLAEIIYSYEFEDETTEEEAYEINKHYLTYCLDTMAYFNGERDEIPMHPSKLPKQAQKPLQPSSTQIENLEEILKCYEGKHASEYLKDKIHERFKKNNALESIQSFLESVSDFNEYKAIIDYKMLPTSSQALEMALMLNLDVNIILELYKRHY